MTFLLTKHSVSPQSPTRLQRSMQAFHHVSLLQRVAAGKTTDGCNHKFNSQNVSQLLVANSQIVCHPCPVVHGCRSWSRWRGGITKEASYPGQDCRGDDLLFRLKIQFSDCEWTAVQAAAGWSDSFRSLLINNPNIVSTRGRWEQPSF